MVKVIVSDLLTKIFTTRIMKKLNGIKMNPYQPPRIEYRDKISFKSVALYFVAIIAMIVTILVYFFVMGSVVKWLS